jgi:hypothetical protein
VRARRESAQCPRSFTVSSCATRGSHASLLVASSRAGPKCSGKCAREVRARGARARCAREVRARGARARCAREVRARDPPRDTRNERCTRDTCTQVQPSCQQFQISSVSKAVSSTAAHEPMATRMARRPLPARVHVLTAHRVPARTDIVPGARAHAPNASASANANANATDGPRRRSCRSPNMCALTAIDHTSVQQASVTQFVIAASLSPKHAGRASAVSAPNAGALRYRRALGSRARY